MKIFAILLAITLLSCREKPEAMTEKPDMGFSGKVGDVLNNGQFVFHVFESVTDDPPYRNAVSVGEDYGIIMFNTGTYDDPILTVKFCSSKEKWIKSVTGMNDILAFIKNLKMGSTLGIYDTCTVPRRAGVPQHLVDRIYKALDARHITVTDQGDDHIFCICPTQQ